MPGTEADNEFKDSFKEAAAAEESPRAEDVAVVGEGKAEEEPIPETVKGAEEVAPVIEEQAKTEETTEEIAAKAAEGTGAAEAIPYEKLLQQKKSLEGMFNPIKAKLDQTEKEKARLAEELEKLKAVPAKAAETTAEEKQADDLPSGDEELKAFREDYPDVSAGVKKELSHAIAPLLKEIEELKMALNPVATEFTQSRVEKHFKEIRDAHSDYDQIVEGDDIQNWIVEQTPILRDAYVKTWEQGSSKDMIKLVSDYKRAKGISVADEQSSDTDKKFASGETVKTKRTTVSGGAIAGKDDFSGAFREATR